MHEKNFHSEENDESLLEEDKYGRLVCRKSRKVYPKWNKLTKKSIEEAFNDESPVISSSSEAFLDKESNHSMTKLEYSPKSAETDIFIGGATEIEAEKLIGSSGFVIYYLMPADGTIPFTLPLMLAYISSQKEYFHFPISQRKHYDPHRGGKINKFRVECGDFTLALCDHRRLEREFLSLEKLIEHYETFAYLDAENGIVETFPVCNTDVKKLGK